MQTFHLDRSDLEEFFELYKGIIAEYNPMIEHFMTGPIIALEIRQKNAV